MYRIQLLIVTAFALLGTQLPAQITLKDLLGKEAPTYVDTFYYPFYDGAQMIEIDNVGAWERNVNWHEQAQPRALSWSSLIPGPYPNVYLFRNKAGQIVKAFNTNESLEALTKAFAKIPLDKKNGVHMLIRGGYHGKKYHSGWGDHHSRMIDFGGLYLVYDTVPAVTNTFERRVTRYRAPKVGLIDSLGNFFLPAEYTHLQPVEDDILVSKDSLCGIMDKKKNFFIPMEYDNFHMSAEDEIVFYKKEKICLIYALYRGKLYEIDHFDFIAFEAMHYDRYNPGARRKHDRYQFRKDGKTGLLDSNFAITTPAIYDYIAGFTEERAICCRENKFGYLDPSGKEVIPCRYTYAEYFRQGISVVQYEGKFRNIDINGKLEETTTRNHEEWRNSRYPQSNGKLSIVQTITGYGLTDDKGVFVVSPIYAQIQTITTFIPPTVQGHGKTVGPQPGIFKAKKFHHDQWGVINDAGEMLLPCAYELIADYPTATGFRTVKKDDKHWGMINGQFEVVVPCIYEGVSMGYEDAHITFWENQKAGIMDTTGKILVPARYSQIFTEKNGRMIARIDSSWGFIDRKGKVLVPFQYQQLQGDFENGLCAAMVNGKWGFIDTTGKFVIGAQYEEVRRFQSGITGVKLNGKWGFINRTGKLVVDYQYEFVGHEWEFDGTCKVRKNGLIGFVDSTGKEVIPCLYKDAWGSSREKGHYLEKDGVKMWVKPK